MSQEKKNKILTVTLAGLLISFLLVSLIQWKSSEIDKDIFKIEDLSSIDKVTFASQNGIIELTFKGSKWLVDHDYNADDQLVTVLFATLQQVEAKRKVAASLSDSISRKIQSNGIKVSLHRGAKLVKELFVGGNANKTETYFMSEGNVPYLMTIPGYRVYVSGIFELGQSGWRDKRIFNFNWRNFKKLSAKFSTQPKQNFVIEDLGFGFDITKTAGTDTTRLNDYLDAVSLLMAKDFISSGSDETYVEILNGAPDVTIEILDLGENEYRLDLYNPVEHDPHVVGKVNGKEGVIFDRQQVLPIRKTRDYFVIKSP